MYGSESRPAPLFESIDWRPVSWMKWTIGGCFACLDKDWGRKAKQLIRQLSWEAQKWSRGSPWSFLWLRTRCMRPQCSTWSGLVCQAGMWGWCCSFGWDVSACTDTRYMFSPSLLIPIMWKFLVELEVLTLLVNLWPFDPLIADPGKNCRSAWWGTVGYSIAM